MMRCRTLESQETFRTRLNGEKIEEMKELQCLEGNVCAGGETEVDVKRKDDSNLVCL